MKPGVALLSAYNKSGIARLALELKMLGWTIYASQGTARYLQEKEIDVRDTTELVGPPLLGHRVVTLSREIHAGLLATDDKVDQVELEILKIPRIDLVYVNFYPLAREIAREGSSLESVIEETDVGGPALLRSAAKGRRIVLCQEYQIDQALAFIRGKHMVEPEKYLSHLAAVAEYEVAEYCVSSSNYHATHANCHNFRNVA